MNILVFVFFVCYDKFIKGKVEQCKDSSGALPNTSVL